MKKPFLTILVLSLTTTACIKPSTLHNQTVIVETPEADNASCDLVDSKGHSWYLHTTPGTATIKKGYGPLTVTCERSGFRRTAVLVEEEYMEAKYNHIINSAYSVLKDPSAHAGTKYPERIIVLMEPKQFANEQERIDWKTRKHSYQKMYQEKKREKRYSEIDRIDQEQREIRKREAEMIAHKAEQDRKAEEWIAERAEVREKAQAVEKRIKRRNEIREQLRDMQRNIVEPPPVDLQTLKEHNNQQAEEKGFFTKIRNRLKSLERYIVE